MTIRSAPVTLSVTGRLLRTRQVAWALVLALFGLMFAGATVNAALHMRRVPLAPVDARIVAVDGVRGRAPALVKEIVAGPAVNVTWEGADGVEQTSLLPTAPLDDLHRAALWVRVLCAVAALLVGVVSFVLTPGTRGAWLFLIFCVNLEITLAFNVLFGRNVEIFARLEPITFALGASLGLHLFSEVPRRIGLFQRRPWAAVLPYVPAMPIVLAALWRPTVLLQLLAPLWSLVGGVFSVSILVAGLRRARREGDEPLESRTRTMLLALCVGLYLPALIHTVRGVTGWLADERWVVHLNAVPVVVYPLATGWALLRQNVMGADRVTTVVVSYAATVVLLALGCGLALVAVPVFFRGELTASPTALVAVTALASLSIVPVYRRLKAAVDRRFQRDRASEERITHELAELMRLALVGDRAKTMQAAFGALKVLAPERVELWLREPGGGAFHPRGSDGSTPGGPERPPVSLGGPLARAMLAEKTGGVEGLAPAALEPEAQAELWERDLAVAAPVVVQGEVRAFVGLGRRASGLRYGSSEQSFLTMVAAQLGLALERGQEGTSIGRYRLERRLGTGGMAEVYLARQTGLAGFERRVAIKRPLPHLGEDAAFIAMLIDEAKLAAQLHHPNIVQTYEVDRQGGTYYIAMEYVEGASLRSLLRASRGVGLSVPLPVVARLATALLDALSYAHDAVDARGRRLGIVHRDVTPGNLLVGVRGEVKLVDFGVARGVGRMQVTQTGMIKGTLAYMAPEQAHGGTVDTRSDLFGAGAILFECLTGEPPFPDGPPPVAPPAMPEVGERAPAAVGAVLARALAFEQEERFATAAAMRDAFLAACGVEPATMDALARWQQETMRLAPREVDIALEEARTETVRTLK